MATFTFQIDFVKECLIKISIRKLVTLHKSTIPFDYEQFLSVDIVSTIYYWMNATYVGTHTVVVVQNNMNIYGFHMCAS